MMRSKFAYLATFVVFLALGCEKTARPLSSLGSNGKTVGEASNDLLSAKRFTRLVIEIDYMPGMRPTTEAVNNLKDMLLQRVNKPDGIDFSMNEIPSGNRDIYTLDQIKDIELANRGQFSSGNTVGAYFLFVDGEFESGNTLGIAYRNTSMCIFQEVILNNSGGLLQPSTATLETAVLNHEFGHIMGLVAIGSPMQRPHRDTPNGAHCVNENCLMYFQVETTDFIGNLVNRPVPGFDQDCINDLRANGGK
jgi:hypothetical protein